MKIYNYLAFSIYKLLQIVFKKDNTDVLINKTSFIITLIILFALYSIKGIVELNGYDDSVISPLYLFAIMLIIWIPNYLYLKKEYFINDDFFFNYRNIVSALIMIFGVVIVFLVVANKNRTRIFKKKGYSQEVIDNGGREKFDPNKKPESLEDEIRLWYYNTFDKKDSIK
ncbi:hypothetical protein [Chryseobacterium sp. MEBOG07]|uniref:hypothetical protein n=1 Tax=Chryseobacterium sp. MEBOG07 TaxID=2879939 RepID=UPI001F229BC3|nr:hypothetical protein [Chryseobacterium sp. MEBOG07]UKB80519.1 hypothetical protein LF886_05875 [Chryseobacterium sp. MEBOG07]